MKQEYEAMLAGIPLLSPAEQQEIFESVNATMIRQITEKLAKLQETAAKATVEQRVARYVKLRDSRAAANKEADLLDRAYKQALEAIESTLIADAQAQGVTGFKTEVGTTYLDERMLTTIADDLAFFTFVKEQGDLDFFERRVKATHVKEWMDANNGVLPPGLNVFRELTMKVRRK